MDEEPAGLDDEVPAGPDIAGLSGLASRLSQVEAQLAGFHQRAAHREAVIDQLHAENQLLKTGLSRVVLEPVVTDLIRLHDQLSREARRQANDGQDAKLAWSFTDEVARVLERCGIDMYTAAPGELFDPIRHNPADVLDSSDETLHNTVAEVTAAGFIDRGTGRVRRPLQARFYRYLPKQ
jgi:molecular chaperone GrpE (heat shock protein)